MKLTYTNVNGYLIPNLTYKSGEQMVQLGKYGFLRRDYLKNHRNSTYQVMLLQDTIGEHLLEVDKAAREREEVILKQFGWSVNWTEKRKHITFQNQNGKKVRDSNLSKTFHLDISKEDLENEFDRNYKRVRAEAERTNGADEELAGYYRQVEAACEGAGGVTGASDGREGQVTGKKSEDE